MKLYENLSIKMQSSYAVEEVKLGEHIYTSFMLQLRYSFGRFMLQLRYSFGRLMHVSFHFYVRH